MSSSRLSPLEDERVLVSVDINERLSGSVIRKLESILEVLEECKSNVIFGDGRNSCRDFLKYITHIGGVVVPQNE